MSDTAAGADRREPVAFVRHEDDRHPSLPPPRAVSGPWVWVRDNLFSSVGNTVLTALAIGLILWILPGLVQWAFIDAIWTGASNDACDGPGGQRLPGACWAIIDARFGQFIFGFYPEEERWRVALAYLTFFVAIVPLLYDRVPGRKAAAIYICGIFPFLSFFLLYGGDIAPIAGVISVIIAIAALVMAAMTAIAPARLVGTVGLAAGSVVALIEFFAGAPGDIASYILLVGGVAALVLGRAEFGRAGLILLGLLAVAVLLSFVGTVGLVEVPTNKWGGLMLTLLLACTAILVSLPLGILLALGRRATNLPAISMVCTAFIELIRAVPLITVLFMASFMLPLFLPQGVNFDELLRALVGVSLFAAAYMAEVVRGGLQALPKGQMEAARAMGLSYWLSMRLIILPQALKIVIPGIVNTFIGLFKDTSLVSIIGLYDLLLVAKVSVTDSKWLGLEHEAYAFVAVIYFIFCFSMSRYSLWLEDKLHTGHKR